MKITTTTLFPIRILSRETGINSVTLRAWERRYGLLIPKRSPSGHRLYSSADLALILRVKQLLADGHSISEIATRLSPAPAATLAPAPLQISDPWSPLRIELLRAVEDFSTERLEHLYGEAISLHPMERVISALIEPVLVNLGERWLKSDLGIAEEHFFSAWLRNRLAARFLHTAGLAKGPRIVCACLPGEQHEIGLLLFALGALSLGYQVIYLGADMPLAGVADAIVHSASRGAVISASLPGQDAAHLERLRPFVTQCKVPILVGGPLGARNAEALLAMGAHPLSDKNSVALHILARVLPNGIGNPG